MEKFFKMKELTSLIFGVAALVSSFATDLQAENKFNTPRFERMTPKLETSFANDLLPRSIKYEGFVQDNSITRRVYPKKDGTEGYITFSISCFGEERIIFFYDFFRKKSFERGSFFGEFKRLPSDVHPDYSKMICSSALI